MTTETSPGELAPLVEAELRRMGQGDLIPEEGLERWINQAWSWSDSDEIDPEEWALDWIDQCDEPSLSSWSDD